VGGRIEACRLLLEAGADPKAINQEGETPLHEAAGRSGSQALLALLLNAGGDPNARDRHGATPLHRAAAVDGVLVRALLERGADPNVRDARGWTPMHVRAGWDSRRVARMLRESGFVDPPGGLWSRTDPACSGASGQRA